MQTWRLLAKKAPTYITGAVAQKMNRRRPQHRPMLAL
jgi:hypothetical protein